jgi:O-antigen/teichoic acid export membrane protein
MIRLRSPGLGTNIVITLFRQGLGLAFALGTLKLLARVLGPDGFGKYQLALQLCTIMATLLNLGISNANVYFLGRGDVSLSVALRTSGKLWLLLGAAGLLLGAVVVEMFAGAWFSGVPEVYLWIAVAGFPVILLHMIAVSFLQGKQDFHRFNVSMFLQPVLLFFLAVVAVFVLDKNVPGALYAYVLSFLFSGLFALWALRIHLQTPEPAGGIIKARDYSRRCIGYGWKAQVAGNLWIVNYRGQLLLINYFLAPDAVGLFMAALVVAEKIWLMSQAVTAVLLPRLSELHTDEERRKKITPLATKLVFYLSILVAVPLFVFARPIIFLVSSGEFESSVTVLRLLLPGMVLLTVARGVSADLAARGRVDLNLYVSIVTVVISIVLNVILIPRYGINGSAVVTTLSYTINLLIRFVLYSRISGNRWYSLLVFRKDEFEVIKRKILSLRGGGN